jgi:hypothetical protein
VRFPAQLSWDAANAACQAIDAHLASIADKTANDAVKSMLAGAAAWIGATDQLGEGTFVWYEGPGQLLQLTFTDWVSGEPDDNPAGKGDCVTIESAGWRDQQCSTPNAYVCEHAY